MNEAFWDRFPKTTGLRCIAMKDRAQARIARETQGLSSDQLFAYFREASHRFWSKVGRGYPEATSAPMAVRESSPRSKRA
jgi:hypothetical protein